MPVFGVRLVNLWGFDAHRGLEAMNSFSNLPFADTPPHNQHGLAPEHFPIPDLMRQTGKREDLNTMFCSQGYYHFIDDEDEQSTVMVRRKIYLDVCCLCRPFDDQTIHRIRMETEAVTEILKRCMSDWELVGSEAIESEISRISDEERMENAESLLQFATSRVVIDEGLEAVARGYYHFGLEPFDALHLACAESVGAVFLTTDDALIKSIKRHEDKITTGVHNPVQWLMEVTMDGSKDAE